MTGSGNLGRTPKVLSLHASAGMWSRRRGNEVFGSPPGEGCPLPQQREQEDDVTAGAVGEPRHRGHGSPVDPAGDRRFLSFGDRGLRPRGRRRAPRRHARLRDLGHARRRRHPTPCSCATPSPATATPSARSARPPHAGLVGRPDRPRQGHRHRPLVRRVRQRARRLPGHAPARPAPTPTTASRGAAASRWSRSATWCARQASLADHLGVAPLAQRGRRLDGRACRRSSGRVMYPERVRLDRADRHRAGRQRPADRLVVAPAAASSASTRAGAAATTTTPRPATGPTRALALARMVSQITFRSDDVFTRRFGREVVEPLDGFSLWQRFEVERYLEYHGDKLVRRFDANSYLLLTKAMDLHDVGRGRGGVDAAMRRVAGAGARPSAWPATSSTRSTRARRSSSAARAARRRGPLRGVDSPHGHDAFLIEHEQVGVPAAAPSSTTWRPDMPDQPDPPHPETTAITAGRAASGDSLAPVLFPSTDLRRWTPWPSTPPWSGAPRPHEASTPASAARRSASSRTPSPSSRAPRRRWPRRRGWAR